MPDTPNQQVQFDANGDPILTAPLPPQAGAPRPPAAVPPGSGAALFTQRVQHYSWAFELAGPQNEQMMCPLDHHSCRGRWSRKNLLGQTAAQEFASAPDLPGLCFVVHTGKRTIRRFDPLAQEQNAPVLKLAQRIFGGVMGVKYEPERPRTLENVSDNVLKTMAFWFYKLVLSNRVNLLVGTVPGFPHWKPGTKCDHTKANLELIRRMPGLVMQESYNSSPLGKNKVVPNDELVYQGPGEDDYRRDPNLVTEIPDPVIFVGVNGAGSKMGYQGGYPSTAVPPGVDVPLVNASADVAGEMADDNEYAERV